LQTAETSYDGVNYCAAVVTGHSRGIARVRPCVRPCMSQGRKTPSFCDILFFFG